MILRPLMWLVRLVADCRAAYADLVRNSADL